MSKILKEYPVVIQTFILQNKCELLYYLYIFSKFIVVCSQCFNYKFKRVVFQLKPIKNGFRNI